LAVQVTSHSPSILNRLPPQTSYWLIETSSRDADPEFGFIQSKELEAHLKEIMAVYDVEVLRGGGVSDGYIEARPKGVSKGLFVNHAIATMKASNNEPDFVLAIGDDSSDEPMFEYLNLVAGTSANTAAAGSSPVTMEVSTFTVTVGKKPSTAQSFVDDPAAVMDVLSTLIKSAQRDRRHSSTADLLASISNTSQVRPPSLYPSLTLSHSLSLTYSLSVSHSLSISLSHALSSSVRTHIISTVSIRTLPIVLIT
jgi:Trehalose-phosphatase